MQAHRGDEYSSCVVAGGVLLRSGSPLDAALKVWAYSDGAVFWELRRIMDAFYSGSGVVFNYKDFKKHTGNLLENEFLEVGPPYEDILKPNLRSFVACNPDTPVRDPYIRKEFSLSTDGVLRLLVLLSTTRKEECDRDQAVSMLQFILAKVVSLQVVSPAFILNQLEATQDQCVDYVDTERFCPHALEVLDELGVCSALLEHWAWDDVANALATLRVARRKCEACR